VNLKSKGSFSLLLHSGYVSFVHPYLREGENVPAILQDVMKICWMEVEIHVFITSAIN